jgi:hypothetical protein
MKDVLVLLWRHKTRVSGFLLTLLGAIQVALPQLQEFMTKRSFAFWTVGVGIWVTVLGVMNSRAQPKVETVNE